MTRISASVGQGGVNRRQDVVTVQTLLNLNLGHLTPLRPLAISGHADPATIAAIEEFQRRVVGTASPDGRVDPGGRTLAQLGAVEPSPAVTPRDAHPASPVGGGGPGFFKSATPLGTHPELDVGSSPQPLGHAGFQPAVHVHPTPSPAASVADQPSRGAQVDQEIEDLDPSETAKDAAYQLKRKHPAVKFTSGRRNTQDQARAMASNVVLNRTWIEETYVRSQARDACQKWVDEHQDKHKQHEIAVGLEGVLDRFTAGQLAHLSKHLSGEAFDVQPVEEDGDEIKRTLRALTDAAGKRGHAGARFLEREGGLVRWHAQF